MVFENVVSGVDLSVIVKKTEDFASEDMDIFTFKKFSKYKIYTKEENISHVIGQCDDFVVHLLYRGTDILEEKNGEL